MNNHRNVTLQIPRAAAVIIALTAGCAALTPMERQLAEMRRQVEMGCMTNLMDSGMPLMAFSEAMSTHCRKVANRRVPR